MAKVCFISCVNDESMYAIALAHIEKLTLPAGITAETLAIKGDYSMAKAYNEAMRLSDAKYKIYLHQDTFITHSNFIQEILAIFQSNAKIGLIGVAGYKTIPPNGIWWETSHKFLYGKVMQYANGSPVNYDVCLPWHYDGGEVTESYVPVKGVDGLLMATQYDLPWREELFGGWHFYDVSQSLEFGRKNYEVAVPCQRDFWVAHACLVLDAAAKSRKMNAYDYYRKIFLKEYQNELAALNQDV